MKKLVSKYEAERLRKRNSLIAGGILIFLMLSSILGYAFQGNLNDNSKNTNQEGEPVIYNGFEFIDEGSFWKLAYNNYTSLLFSYNPTELEVINDSSISKSLDSYAQKQVYIYSEDQNAKSEIKRNLIPFAESVETACLTAEQCPYLDAPIKTCADNVIVIKADPNEGISEEGNCVIISGEGENLIKLADEFLFKLLGVN